MVCVSYVPILTAGVMLCIVGDVQKFSVSFAKLDHGLCIICPHTYGWCHVVYSGGCAEVHWTMFCVSYVPILSAGVMLCIVGDVQKFSVYFAKLDHGLCFICPHTYGWCHVVYCGGCAEVQCVFCQTGPLFVYHVPILSAGVMLCIVGDVQKFSVSFAKLDHGLCHMSPYLRLVSCCVLWGMCRSSVCLLPNWTMVCVSYVRILTAGVMLCIVGEVQKFTGPWFMCFMSPYLLLVSYYALHFNTFVI